MKGMCFCTILERLCPVLSIQYLNNKKYISIYVSWIKKKNIKERLIQIFLSHFDRYPETVVNTMLTLILSTYFSYFLFWLVIQLNSVNLSSFWTQTDFGSCNYQTMASEDFNLEKLEKLFAKCKDGDLILMDAYVDAYEELSK